MALGCSCLYSTGIKCLPADKLPLYGDVLHDSHAEIIARRGFLLWLYKQLESVYTEGEDVSPYLERSEHSDGLLRLRQNLNLAMYISTLPCEQYPLCKHEKIDPKLTRYFSQVVMRLWDYLRNFKILKSLLHSRKTSMSSQLECPEADKVSIHSLHCVQNLVSSLASHL